MKRPTAITRTARLAGLLATTAIIAAPGLATAQQDGLDDRVSRIERMLESIMERLEQQGERLEETELEALKAADDVVKQRQEVQELREMEQKTAARVQAIEPENKPLSGFMIGDTNITLGGFVKLDVSSSRYSDGEVPSNSLLRDFYLPGLIPVSGTEQETDYEVDFNPRETRFYIDTVTPLNGHDLRSHIEFDFQVTNVGDNERVSNSFAPRMRQAFLTYRGFLIGQAWSTFQDVAALPEALDFIGPAESTVFNRQPMIRYTNGPFQIAIEQPETTITTASGGRLTPGDDSIPDIVGRYSYEGSFGFLRLAGIFRNLEADEAVPGVDDTAIGYGASFSGKFLVGARDDLRFMVTGGEGIGRYVGVNIINDAAIEADGDLDPIGMVSAYAAYRHFWAPKWRSNVMLGGFWGDNPTDLTGFGVTDQAWSLHANLLYSPVAKLTLGVEYIYAEREIESGLTGNMSRVLFSARYGF